MSFDVHGQSRRYAQYPGSEIDRANRTQPNPSGLDTVGGSGTLNGVSVQQARQARAPAPQSGLGAQIKNFFTTSLPNFFKGAFNKFMSLFSSGNDVRPTAPQTAPTTTAPTQGQTTPKLPPKLFTTDIFGSSGLPFDVGTTTTAEKHEASYALVRTYADKMTTDGVGAFLRSNNPASSSAKALGQIYAQELASDILEDMKGAPPLALSPPSYTEGGTQSFDEIRKDGRSDATIAKEAVNQLERAMERLVGNPGDPGSIAKAAAKVPQELKNQLATIWKAIDDSGASPELKQTMKEHAARDALVLRSFTPSFSAPPTTNENVHTTPIRNQIEIGKAVMLMVNGKEFNSTNAHPEVLKIGGGLGKKWGDAFQEFARQVVMGADPGVVGEAKSSGTDLVNSFTNRVETWNAKLEQGLDPRIG